MIIYYRYSYSYTDLSYNLEVDEYDIIAVVGDTAACIDAAAITRFPDTPDDAILDYINDGLGGLFDDVWGDLSADPNSDFCPFFPASELPARYPDAIRYIPDPSED